MAAIKSIPRRDGRCAFQIAFTLNGKRRYVSLSAYYNEAEAVVIRDRIDALVKADAFGESIGKKEAAWLATIPDDLRAKLVSVGLIESNEKKKVTLREMWLEYFREEVEHMKQTTRSSKTSSENRFFKFYDKDAAADSITRRDAEGFVEWLKASFAEATIAGTIRDVRRVYNWAIEKELVEKNPFTAVVRGSFRNKTREYYVTIEDYQRLLDASPSQEFRALLALYRIGGLRKDEALRLEWRDVDWIKGRVLVHSPKTERYKGRESRIIPLFPKLREELERLYNKLPEGAPSFVIVHNRTTILQKLERVVFLAGLVRWERLIQNLRASCSNDIYRKFGALAEREWIGHSERTAENHYLSILDADYERAINEIGSSEDATPFFTPKSF